MQISDKAWRVKMPTFLFKSCGQSQSSATDNNMNASCWALTWDFNLKELVKSRKSIMSFPLIKYWDVKVTELNYALDGSDEDDIGPRGLTLFFHINPTAIGPIRQMLEGTKIWYATTSSTSKRHAVQVAPILKGNVQQQRGRFLQPLTPVWPQFSLNTGLIMIRSDRWWGWWHV